ncbi:YdcF family protein [Wenzhouxiangella sp. XN201]|uniref:YdcF family protein n=1 Tax=Wenzhouxiangella sp. XN201 TaxID=2710755 RepID=UPI0013C92902|nr:YdcF family protein [Wenzhouxiangella sp. XN201]NEZ02600.1 YdcF family protein [Wenzhouxiangella sp. XN201]
MNTVSTLTLRGALADPALRETLLASTVFLVLSLGLTYLVAWLYVIRSALVREARSRVDRLLVCGHALRAGRPSDVYRQRLHRAAKLACDDPSLDLLLAGGGAPSEAAVGREWLLAQAAVDADRIGLEAASTDTFENLRHAREMLGPETRLGIVTSRFHLARVLIYARQLGLRAAPVPAEDRWRWTVDNVKASLREAAFLKWFVCGRFWAQIARRQSLLERIR